MFYELLAWMVRRTVIGEIILGEDNPRDGMRTKCRLATILAWLGEAVHRRRCCREYVPLSGRRLERCAHAIDGAEHPRRRSDLREQAGVRLESAVYEVARGNMESTTGW